jgi:DNA-binding response OmpR family regulator
VLLNHGYASVAVATSFQGRSVVTVDGGLHFAIGDMDLPGAAGLDLAAELDRQHPGLRILYISDRVGSIATEAIARSSSDLVLLKPFTEASLMDRVHRLMAKPPVVQGALDGSRSKSA